MGKRDNIHDENFKHNFTNEAVARDFLKYNLPKKLWEKIDIETLKIENSELLPSRYRSKRSVDIIYSVRGRQNEKLYTLVHLEAQSNHNKHMAYRVWEYHVAIANYHRLRGNGKVPLILTFVLYNGEEEWESARSIAEIFKNFDLYVDLSLKTPFLIDFKKMPINQLKEQGAAAGPQMIMKGKIEGNFGGLLDDIYPYLKLHDQIDDENINYMVTTDVQGEIKFLEKFSKFDNEKANNYRVMFEAAIERESQKALKLGKKEGIKLGEEKGIKLGKKEMLRELVKKGIITQEVADQMEEGEK